MMFTKKYIFIFLILLIFITPFTFARSFKITDYTINYKIQESGKIDVSEYLTYEFFGCYSQIYIQRPNIQIAEYTGGCSGAECTFEYKPYGTESGDPELILHGNFCDTTVHAHFTYILLNQIRELEDAAQFYYKVYPGETTVSTDLNINISFPGDVNQVTKFIHSKDYLSQILFGELRIYKKVGIQEIIEVNLLMPKDWFDKNGLIQYYNKDYNTAQITQQEENWEKGYSQYTKKYVKEEASIGIIVLYILLLAGLPLLLLFLIWLIFGREISPNKLGYLSSYERELPGDEDPLQAHYLITGEMSPMWFSSAIMYLVWKKQYTLEKIQDKSLFNSEKYKLVKIKNAEEIPLPSYVLNLKKFFEKYYPDGEINLDDFKTGQYKTNNNSLKEIFSNMDERMNFSKDFIELQKTIKKDLETWAKKNKYLDKTGSTIAKVTIVVYFSFIYLFIQLIFRGYKIPNLVPLSVFLFFFITILITNLINPKSKLSFAVIYGRFSKEGRLKNLQWTNFKKYITDFSLIKGHPPTHVILWEEYMVYATAFGVAKVTSKALKTAMPEEVSNNQSFAIYSSFAASSFSTSSGHSSLGGSGVGGFGGGGFGGGGGGGGAGAR